MAFEDDVIELMGLTAKLAARRAENYPERNYSELLNWSDFLRTQSEKDVVREAIREAYERLALETSFLSEETLRNHALGEDEETEGWQLDFLLNDTETGAGVVAQGLHREVRGVNVRLSASLENQPNRSPNHWKSALENAATFFESLSDAVGSDPKVKGLFGMWAEFAKIFAS